MKKFITWFLVIGMMAGCVNGEIQGAKERAEEEEKQEEKEPVKEKPAPAPEPKEEEPEVATDDLLSPEFMLEILQQSYATTAEVTYDEANKVFKVMPTNPDFATAIVLMESGQMAKTEWDIMIDAMLSMSENMSTGYAVYLMNPSNPDRVLAAVMNGMLIYDGINDERPFEGM